MVQVVVKASSESQGVLVGTMQFFQTKVYFKSGRASGIVFLPNQFQKCSDSVPLIGQKNIYLANQGRNLPGRLCHLLTWSGFLYQFVVDACHVQWENSCGEFKTKRCKEWNSYFEVPIYTS